MNVQPLSFSMLKTDCRDMDCIGCGELMQKGSRRIHRHSFFVGGSIEENLEETRAKKMIDLCKKCFNSYVKVKKELEVSSQVLI